MSISLDIPGSRDGAGNGGRAIDVNAARSLDIYYAARRDLDVSGSVLRAELRGGRADIGERVRSTSRTREYESIGQIVHAHLRMDLYPAALEPGIDVAGC